MKKSKNSERTRFVAARRNSDGTLSEFKDENGNVYDYEQALEAVEQGMIENALPAVMVHVISVASTMETNQPTYVI